MRILVTGLLYKALSPFDLRELDRLRAELDIKLIVVMEQTGHAADAREWARKRGVGVRFIRADTAKYGAAARRFANLDALASTDALIVFGRGEHNDDLVAAARRLRVPTYRRSSNGQIVNKGTPLFIAATR